MATASVLEAKTHLSKLIAAAQAGEDVTITKNNVPVAKLVPIQDKAKRRFGLHKGQFAVDESFFEPLPDDELRAWGEM